ncbi:MAG: tetratricopeptide repeat protein [Gemmatimonadaceae bacterium]|nr:tetratricopeptide repeat protein [Gemmatimonadaceae bacterium]MDQ3243332.1 tetratricopeptide repeat protein [Gemmatimonadota bacterium]
MAILETGLQLFPNSSALLTRLAEVELAKGDKAAAVAAFRRALTADPFNQYAGLQFKKLSAGSE